MADSYIIEGTNIVCTNMQVSAPLKIGSSRQSPAVRKASGEIILNEDDKKISSSFECKMAAKKWGGLAYLLAGVAIAGALLLCVATAGTAAPALLAVAVAATQAGVVAATVGSVVSAGIGLYQQAHDCDYVLDGQWQGVHSGVLIQGKHALLNSSYLSCPKGGTLTLIIDGAIASEAAQKISDNNSKEITAQLASKFFIGFVGGLSGGANMPGVVLATSFDIAFENGTSNVEPDTGQDLQQAGIEFGADTAWDATKSGVSHGLEAWAWRNIMLMRILSGASEESIASAANMYGMVLNAPKYIWTDLAKDAGIGLGGAVISFAIDQWSNSYERGLERDVTGISDSLNEKDDSNNIGIIANEK